MESENYDHKIRLRDSRLSVWLLKLCGCRFGKWQTVGFLPDSTGAKKWDYLSIEKRICVGLDLVVDGNDCYLVPIITLNAEKP
jgi:hypothetical protein